MIYEALQDFYEKKTGNKIDISFSKDNETFFKEWTIEVTVEATAEEKKLPSHGIQPDEFKIRKAVDKQIYKTSDQFPTQAESILSTPGANIITSGMWHSSLTANTSDESPF